MAITKNIVDMMGGTIEVQTAQGKGSEFIIRVPMRAQAEHRPVEKITELEGDVDKRQGRLSGWSSSFRIPTLQQMILR